MPKRPPFLRGRTVCIFCGGASGATISKEHIFPDWLRELFPRSPHHTHTHGITSWVGLRAGSPITTRRQRQGQVTGRRVRIVCKKCNNEWLSDLEGRTKPLILDLLRGGHDGLSPEEQNLLATWAAKTCMTAEFLDRSKIAIPQGDRTHLMRTISPPKTGWWIWIAGNAGLEWIAGISHFSAHFSEIPPIAPEATGIPNVQSTTLGLGCLLFHIVSTTFPDLSFALDDPAISDLRPIWPASGAALPWPPDRFLTDEGVNGVARNIARAFGRDY
jgi:hypothetical protein